ncbi:MAG: ATP-dependent zinc metalloprotease FtsH, partial [Clostridiales bacterium]|nr:ATP-dependent zinc metalloprotease FtsH [Clostridiales bacterium]
VTRYGFSDKLGPIVYGQDSDEVFLGRDFSQNRNYSENVAAEIDAEIREIVEDAYETAKEILEKNRETLIVVAEYLLTHEKIDGIDFEKLMKGELEEIADDEFKKEVKEHKDELSEENPQDIDLDEGKRENKDEN